MQYINIHYPQLFIIFMVPSWYFIELSPFQVLLSVCLLYVLSSKYLADFNLAYLQKYGFNTPLLFKEKSGLGLQVPDSSFTINDVRSCVGEWS